jgi:hypothetical protein
MLEEASHGGVGVDCGMVGRGRGVLMGKRVSVGVAVGKKAGFRLKMYLLVNGGYVFQQSKTSTSKLYPITTW